MTLPFSDTTISVLRSNADDTQDAYPDAAATWPAVQTGIAAHISAPGGTTVRDGVVQTRTNFTLAADPCDLRHTDRVLDETTQQTYRVEWVGQRIGFGLDHTSAGLSAVEGFI